MAQGGGEVWSRPTTRTPQLALSPLPPEDPRASVPLLALVSGAFEAMASTRYQHRTEVDPDRGSYRFDCVGLVSWALKQATPQAWASLRETMALSPGRIPSPPTMVRFFAGLARQPQPGSGRCLAASSSCGAGSFSMTAARIDATQQPRQRPCRDPRRHPRADRPRPVAGTGVRCHLHPHEDDSRPLDRRAMTFERTGRPSSLGQGVIALVADPSDGALRGFRWRPTGPSVLAPIGAGRPLR